MPILPPPPLKEELPHVVKEWFNKVYQYMGGSSGQFQWNQVSKDGANLSDIPVRPHSQLQALTADDHTQYVHTNASRPMSADWDAGNFRVTSQNLAADDFVIFNKASGKGIKVDQDSPTFGWRDLIGDVSPKTSGPGSPALTSFISDIRWYNYGAGDDGDTVFHVPHDYVPGSDMFIHIHWAHNGTNISGTFSTQLHLAHAKGHQQANFPIGKEPVLTVSSLNITNTPQYRHRVDEIQISTPGGSATLLDSNDIEVDGLILVHYDVLTIPTITGGSGKPFIFALDIHYQSTGIPTKNKVPNFYA